jgi:hypothetical protein
MQPAKSTKQQLVKAILKQAILASILKALSKPSSQENQTFMTISSLSPRSINAWMLRSQPQWHTLGPTS